MITEVSKGFLEEIGPALLAYLRKHGTSMENDLRIGANPYKPTYRLMSYLFSSTFDSPWTDAFGKDVHPTPEVAAKVFKAVHPFFKHFVENDWEFFVAQYNFMKEAWE